MSGLVGTASLVGAVTDTVTKVGLAAVAGDVAGSTAKVCLSDGNHVGEAVLSA